MGLLRGGIVERKPWVSKLVELRFPCPLNWSNFVFLASYKRLRASRIASNMLALTFVNFANAFLPMITVPYLVRVLSAEGFGRTAYAQSFVSYFNVIFEYGFALTATRAISAVRGDRFQLSEVVSSIVWSKIVLVAVTSLVFLTLIFFIPDLREDSALFFVAFLNSIAMTAIPVWLYQGIERLPDITWVSVGFRLSQIPLMLIFVHSRQDLLNWLLVVLVTTSFTVGVIWLKTVPRIVNRPRWPGWAKIGDELRFGVLIFGAQLSVSMYTVGNPFVLGQLIGLKAAGIYAASERIVRIFFSFASSVQQAIFSRSAELVGHDPMQVIQLARLSLFVNFLIALVLSFFLWILAPLIQTILLGAEFVDAASVLRWMSVLPILFALGGTLTLQIVVPFRFDKGLIFVYFGAGILNLLVAFLLVPKYGILGMVFAVISAEIFVVLMQIYLIYRNGIKLFSRL
jgi:polysaccharide transporter, PST family